MAKSKTVAVMASVHEDGVWVGKNAELQAVIERAYHRNVQEGVKFRVIWAQLPKGQAWLAGHPSTASMLVVPVPDDIAQEDRVAMLSDICAGWMDATGCKVEEIIVNAFTESAASRYLEVSQSRFDPEKATGLKLKLLGRLLKSKLSQGFMTTSINMP